jgi:hypothetical protein
MGDGVGFGRGWGRGRLQQACHRQPSCALPGRARRAACRPPTCARTVSTARCTSGRCRRTRPGRTATRCSRRRSRRAPGSSSQSPRPPGTPFFRGGGWARGQGRRGKGDPESSGFRDAGRGAHQHASRPPRAGQSARQPATAAAATSPPTHPRARTLPRRSTASFSATRWLPVNSVLRGSAAASTAPIAGPLPCSRSASALGMPHACSRRSSWSTTIDTWGRRRGGAGQEGRAQTAAAEGTPGGEGGQTAELSAAGRGPRAATSAAEPHPSPGFSLAPASPGGPRAAAACCP